jgi:hypothetical protein
MLPLTRSRDRARFFKALSAVWTPLQLFANNEVGAWYDPSDLTTLYQDSAGTTPVTAVEQPVGLMLDKSKGLVLGPELVTNGTFDADDSTGWTLGSWTVSDNKLNKTAGDTNIATGSILPTITGVTYRIEFDADISAGSVTPLLRVGTSGTQAVGVPVTTSGKKIQYITATAVHTTIRFAPVGTAFAGTIDNISVRELPGNHAFQTVSTSRPVLSARVNLLTKTEDFSDAVWTKASATSVSSPDSNAPGAMYAINSTADSISSATRYVAQTVSIVSSTQYTTKFYVKAGTQSSVRFMTRNDDVIRGATFSLTGSGSVTSTNGDATASILNIGDGIYFCTVTWTSGTDISILCAFNSATSVFGDGATMFYVSAPDLRVANDGINLPAYQRVNTATDYDTVGFPTYLRFDGVDDGLQTNSINFSATDKMTVFAGVRKLSDASIQVLYELSSNINSNNGTFNASPGYAGFGSSVGAYWSAAAKGTLISAATTPATFPSPWTAVQAHQINISSDQSLLRVNGAQAAISTADQGSGNFGSYPLYIGRRGGTSLPFNGWLTQLIVRGAQSSTAQIEAAEAYVNNLTKAYA